MFEDLKSKVQTLNPRPGNEGIGGNLGDIGKDRYWVLLVKDGGRLSEATQQKFSKGQRKTSTNQNWTTSTGGGNSKKTLIQD